MIPVSFQRVRGGGYQVNVQGMGSSSKRGGEWSFEKWEVSQILPKSWSLAQPSNGSQSLRYYVCWSHICFSIKSLNFSVSVSDFKMPVSASW